MKLFSLLLGIILPVIALFISLLISPAISGAFFSPIAYLSDFLTKIFINMPYHIHSIIILSFAFISSVFVLYFSKYLLKKLNF